MPIRTRLSSRLSACSFPFIVFERTLVLGFRGLNWPLALDSSETEEFSPPIGRRALILGGLGLARGGWWRRGAAEALSRRDLSVTTARNTKARSFKAITPNEQFYCVTKNVVDPKVDAALWRLEVTGLVKDSPDLHARSPEEPDRGDPGDDADVHQQRARCRPDEQRRLERRADAHYCSTRRLRSPSAAKVRLHGVDNYTDTIPLEKALDPTTLVVYEMNGETLPDRHGFPARAIVPGYFGEKHVKWITRIELAEGGCRRVLREAGLGAGFHRADSIAHR